MVAEIIINTTAKELNKTFDYIIPEKLINSIKIGSRVIVPFGEKRKSEGYVVNIKEDMKFATKEIIKLEDNFLSEENIEFAKLMAKRYFCNLSDCVKLLLPPGKSRKKKVIENSTNTRIKNKDNPLELTEEQKKAYMKVEEIIKNNIFKEFLLYGVTGSRKNRNIFAINSKSYRK